MTTTPPTEQQLDLDEIAAAIAAYRQHAPTGFACCTAHPVADAGAALLAALRDARAEIDKLARWHREDETALKEMRGTVEGLRKKHKANLRRADEINNELMAEVQRYADGEEAPVLWSVYNAMHLRAATAEGRVSELETAMQKIRRLHCDSPMGPCPVCIDADAIVAGGDGLVPYPCPTGRLAGAQDCDPPHVRAAAAPDPVCGDANDSDWCELEPGHEGHHGADTAEWAVRPAAPAAAGAGVEPGTRQ